MIQNAEILNQIVKETKITGIDIVPRKIANKVQPIIISNVQHKENTFVHHAVSSSFFTSIFTTDPHNDTYITGMKISWTASGTDIEFIIQTIIHSGEQLNIMVVKVRDGNAGQQTIILPVPIRLAKNTFVFLGRGFFQEDSIANAVVYGFEVATLEKADG